MDKLQIVKKCLLIGINYTGTSNQLNGCINDSENLKEFLLKNKYMKEEDIVMMNDNCEDELYPSKKNIERQLNGLVEFAKKNEDKDVVRIFVEYSGHGSYMMNYDRTEVDFHDEVLCCLNNEYITDNYLKKQFIDRLPKNVKLVFICDACYSGTICDLKFTYKNGVMVDNADIATESNCEVVVLSGSTDGTTSSDAYLKNKITGRYEYMGAMTKSFFMIYKDGITYKSLIEGMRSWIKDNNFLQVPQLQSDGYVDANSQFLLGTYDD